jgi:hypothetical protein
MRVILILLFPFLATSQVNWGLQIGLSANVGSHYTGIGVFGRTYINYKFIQLNYTTDLQYSALSTAERRNMLEFRNSIGAVFVGGKETRSSSFVLDGLNHNTNRNLGAGYALVHYWDNKKTSQLSGGFALHIGKIAITMENDVFGGQAKDRFRTGHARISYSDSLQQYALGINLWTGETANTSWQRVCLPKMPQGYRLLEDQDYGGTSHGIVYIEGRLAGPFNQQPLLRLGIDSEEIRHQVQNRLLHDLVFLPKGVKRSTPHYPRVDENGCATFDAKNRRKDRVYIQLGLNDYDMH